MDEEMMKALEADGEMLRSLTGEDHGPVFFDAPGNLDDATILAAIRDRGGIGTMTYVIANILGRKWPTAVVRRRLQSMEKRDLVRRVPSNYATQICWAAESHVFPPADGAASDPPKVRHP